ncbi:hypothetical protein [Paracoccus mutanolyticus]|nr:hypothetical protein [Paracoccus mutanolyticus]
MSCDAVAPMRCAAAQPGQAVIADETARFGLPEIRLEARPNFCCRIKH